MLCSTYWGIWSSIPSENPYRQHPWSSSACTPNARDGINITHIYIFFFFWLIFVICLIYILYKKNCWPQYHVVAGRFKWTLTVCTTVQKIPSENMSTYYVYIYSWKLQVCRFILVPHSIQIQFSDCKVMRIHSSNEVHEKPTAQEGGNTHCSSFY